MADSSQPRVGRLLIWLTVAVAALMAYEIPTAWIAYSDRQIRRSPVLNFHPLLVILYVPLAFGVFWPVLIRVAAWAKQRRGQSIVWPAKTAAVVFIVSACGATCFVRVEYLNYVRGLERVRADKMRDLQLRSQQKTEELKALAEMQANGVASLSEPLTGPQTLAVYSYLDANSRRPAELENAARHYRTSLLVMEHLSQMRDCPGSVLEIVFDNIVDLQKDPPPQSPLNPYAVLYDIAWHPNVPTPVLVRMVNNSDSEASQAAAASLVRRQKNQR